jgi:uncharacterized protein (DUF1810 family)
MAREFGIADAEEASAYAAHPVLGTRLVDCVRAILSHEATLALLGYGSTLPAATRTHRSSRP